MKFSNIKHINSQLGRGLVVIGVLSAFLISMLLPALTMAATFTERSVTLSSSSKGATGVNYEVAIKPSTTAGAVVLDFCTNTPLIGESCTAPVGFSVASATVDEGTKAPLTAAKNNATVIVDTFTANNTATFTLAGVTNPTDAGTVYVRVVSFADLEDAEAYTSTISPNSSDILDSSSLAISITDTIGVSGSVLESLSFCIAGGEEAIAPNCNVTGLDAPTLVLGEDDGNGILALTPSVISTGVIQTQISTNAATGAVVSLKSSAAGCGGLLLAGSPTACYIQPAQATGITAGQAKFGLLLGTSGYADEATGTTGELVGVGNYNDTTYALNYDADGEETGVTGPFGDPIMSTNDAAASNVNMPLTFGVSISNATPGGSYSADLSLIATGKF